MTHLPKGPATCCDSCDYPTQRRVRVKLVPNPWTSATPRWKNRYASYLMVCASCAIYLVERHIATKAIRPRGIRKAGAGEHARCSRFAD